MFSARVYHAKTRKENTAIWNGRVAGSIVVARMTRLDIIIGIEKIYGVVTERGGNLCHAVIITQERNIPYLVGTKKATEFSSKTAPS